MYLGGNRRWVPLMDMRSLINSEWHYATIHYLISIQQTPEKYLFYLLKNGPLKNNRELLLIFCEKQGRAPVLYWV